MFIGGDKEQVVLEQYCSKMEEIKLRMEVVDFFMTGKGHALYQPSTIETICLQIRKILELIAFSSLIVNETEYSKIHSDFTQHWNAKKLINNLKKINPDFYPVPILEIPSKIQGITSQWEYIKDGFLTTKEFIDTYEKCGSIMHIRNPFRPNIDYELYSKKITYWTQKIIKLLDTHFINFTKDKGFYLIHMSEAQDKKVHWYRFEAHKIP